MLLKIPQWRSLNTRVTLFTLLIFVTSIWSLAFYASQILHKDMERLSGEQQLSTVRYVAAQVNDEFKERILGLELIAGAIDASLLVNPVRLQSFLENRFVLHSLFNGGSFITRTDGIAIASYPAGLGRVGNSFGDLEHVSAALNEGKATVSRPRIGRTLGAPVVSIAVPIRDARGKVMGAFIGVTDLSQPNFLDKITSNTYGKTGGYLLVAAKYRLVVTATDKSRVMDPLPAPGVMPQVDRFIEGFDGPVVLTNPRGVEVLASASRIPDIDWYVAVQLPTQEAFAPIHDMQRRLLFATIFLTLLAGALTWLMLKRQLAPMLAAAKSLAQQSDTNLSSQPLPIIRQDEIGQLIGGFNRLLETLAQREAILKQVLDTSSVAIFLVNTEGRITQANQRMAEMFGCAVEALPGSEYVALIHPDERETGRQKMQALMSSDIESVDLDRLYWRADGSQFWGHLTGRRFHDVSGKQEGLVGVIADISARKHMEDSLKISESRFRKFFEKNSSVMFLMDPLIGKIVDANASALRYFGYPKEHLIGLDITQINTLPLEQLIEQRQKALREEVNHFEFPYRLASGEIREVEVYATPIESDGRSLLFCIVHDITERNESVAKLEQAASVFANSREGIMITAVDGAIIDVNEAFTRITGYNRDEVLGKNPRILNSGRQQQEHYLEMWRSLAENGHWYGEVWNRRKTGEVYAELQTISTVRDAQGQPQQYVALFSDITSQKEHQSQLEHIAHYDALTGLPNRVLLADRLQQAMSQTERRGQRLAVAYLDLDGFKAVNDHHGHEAGDQLLMTVATRMKQALREGDTLARLGGDEFVAVLLDLGDVASSVPMLNRLLVAAALPVEFGDFTLQVSASLGVTFYPQVDDAGVNQDADQLLRQADQAMYQAKLAGKNRYHFFDAEQDGRVRSHHESIDRIARALADKEFVLHYQPKVNMRTGAVIGAEALIRWQHPEQGLLPPAAFLPVIEDHPLAVDIGEWVIDTALSQIERWQAEGLCVPVSVNVGARQLQMGNFVPRLREILAAHPDVQPGSLELEVLETSALEDLAQVSQHIEDCRKIGVGFSLDDFGTGYSSLTYLKRLSVVQLKIDQSFVRDMLEDPDDLAILQGVLGLAIAFRREAIAEGVETVEHGEMLLQLGCELAQGYGIARPMPANDFPGWAAVWRPDPVWADLASMRRDDLPLLFASVEHRAWVFALESHFKGLRDAPPLDHQACRFGFWLEGEWSRHHSSPEALALIDALHRKVHTLAEELCALQAQGRAPEALARMGELHELRDALLVQLKVLSRESRD
jgi:diguanylate cyclase (GGDEF)-like protein/PAS domain S-box-containing protein